MHPSIDCCSKAECDAIFFKIACEALLLSNDFSASMICVQSTVPTYFYSEIRISVKL